MTALSRRGFVAGTLAAAAALAAQSVPSMGAIDPLSALERLVSVRGAEGRFVQIAPDGKQSEGSFKIRRPGKARFDFDSPSPLVIVADGRTLAVNNARLKTWNLYPLSKTPLNMLLAERIDVRGGSVARAGMKDGMPAVTLADPAVFGDATVEVLFSPSSGDLVQWTVKDSRGKETVVLVYDMRPAGGFPEQDFRIPYSEIRKGK